MIRRLVTMIACAALLTGCSSNDGKRGDVPAPVPSRGGNARPDLGPPNTEPPTRWPGGTKASPLTGAPTRVRIPSIGVDSSLEALHLDAKGELTPPVDFDRAGWYAEGAAPGDVGPAVIAGHVDSRTGPAVFYRLHELRPGSTVEVTRGGGVARFRVISTSRHPKARFPTDQVYGPTPDAQLRLITCGGVFDPAARSYADNIVVFAVSL